MSQLSGRQRIMGSRSETRSGTLVRTVLEEGAYSKVIDLDTHVRNRLHERFYVDS